ncbi:MAG: Hsp20/alpha crystallin family protein [Candidatus Aenigmarchaeota archaeon]|nr:Hsp20/alpha crystallin family protein [Candidatus Aenigmarchaeota archaeon]
MDRDGQMDKKKKKEFVFFWEEPLKKKAEAHADDNFFAPDFGKDMEQMMNEIMKNFLGGSNFSVKVSAPITIQDRGGEFVMRAELPGFEKKDVNMHVSENRIEISAEKKTKRDERSEQRFFTEASHSRLARSFMLPEPIDADRVEAVFRNGVLIVRMPKLRTKKFKKIDLE